MEESGMVEFAGTVNGQPCLGIMNPAYARDLMAVGALKRLADPVLRIERALKELRAIRDGFRANEEHSYADRIQVVILQLSGEGPKL
jgi:hypothetical protein